MRAHRSLNERGWQHNYPQDPIMVNPYPALFMKIHGSFLCSNHRNSTAVKRHFKMQSCLHFFVCLRITLVWALRAPSVSWKCDNYQSFLISDECGHISLQMSVQFDLAAVIDLKLGINQYSKASISSDPCHPSADPHTHTHTHTHALTAESVCVEWITVEERTQQLWVPKAVRMLQVDFDPLLKQTPTVRGVGGLSKIWHFPHATKAWLIVLFVWSQSQLQMAHHLTEEYVW